jgi:hypothetical protein
LIEKPVSRNFRFGLRREPNLTFLDEAGKPHSRARFSGIDNLDEVKAVFAKPSFDSLHYLRYSRTEPSKPGKRVFEFLFDRWEERCVIRCSKLDVVEADSSND